jgi:hypothetical protein
MKKERIVLDVNYKKQSVKEKPGNNCTQDDVKNAEISVYNCGDITILMSPAQEEKPFIEYCYKPHNGQETIQRFWKDEIKITFSVENNNIFNDVNKKAEIGAPPETQKVFEATIFLGIDEKLYYQSSTDDQRTRCCSTETCNSVLQPNPFGIMKVIMKDDYLNFSLSEIMKMKLYDSLPILKAMLSCFSSWSISLLGTWKRYY